jgi:hypothetical protein
MMVSVVIPIEVQIILATIEGYTTHPFQKAQYPREKMPSMVSGTAREKNRVLWENPVFTVPETVCQLSGVA